MKKTPSGTSSANATPGSARTALSSPSVVEAFGGYHIPNVAPEGDRALIEVVEAVRRRGVRRPVEAAERLEFPPESECQFLS